MTNTSKGVLFLSSSDAYVRSFLYLLYTLIKFYYTKGPQTRGAAAKRSYPTSEVRAAAESARLQRHRNS